MSTPERLAQILTNKGAVLPEWKGAVASVDRKLFVPDTVEVDDRPLSRSERPERWLTVVYGDLPLVTQVNDGKDLGDDEAYRLPTSSSSMPSLMLEMLQLLDVREGHRAMDAGAGTGYNLAWLSHRLGSDNVFGIDVDPVIVEQAIKNLAAAGYTPHVVCGDAEKGCADGALHDRWLATFTVPEIPYAWVEQTPAGRIVAPWGGSYHSYSFAVLDVRDGVAEGRFSGYPAFMRSRTNRPDRGYLSDFLHHQDDAARSTTALSPRDLAAEYEAKFFIGLGLRDAWSLLAEANDGSYEATLWLLADDRMSWASVDYVPGHDTFAVEQYGPRSLWDELEAAYRRWERLGRPESDRAGLTVTSGGQHV
ncbi:methyltransferase domain-containing protein [Streptomyces albireticuli]|uniref:Protein-L-isoaspartate O-methyltransferase n=1 Tax=Streptomyces albireticuli TaxID=1940 RepID=A0A2A2D6G2_9ACTN|nr:methyltransferase domain-containing protein [Streptomyces albireticuli]MCD9165764.1 methyltransferase domain-containing protein [Streptomyces albireticuli]MCD9195982.1 methyltransferase domain-containing protein [Streptomyces albireticuli]PAU46920.1 protein-L-isoaspartate(D-aspartate) O-methyltransferase [Streptomyces albireticuli]